MTPVLCAAEFWRNFKPRAPDMKVTVKAGHEVTIAFDAILVQGATDENNFSPTEGILDKVSAQRGWALQLLTTRPKNGSLRFTSDMTGLIYKPRNQYLGPDCFNYRLSNGTQVSDFARVDLEVIDSMYYAIKAYKWNGKFKLSASPHFAPDSKRPTRVLFKWYLVGPMAFVENGVTRIRESEKLLAATKYVRVYVMWTNDHVTNIVQQYQTIEVNGDTDAGLVGLLGDTQLPYRPTGNALDIRLDVECYDTPLIEKNGWYATPYFVGSTLLSDVYGEAWSTSGNIYPWGL